MLLLTETTLFYFTLRATSDASTTSNASGPKKAKRIIKNWAESVAAHGKVGTKPSAPSSKLSISTLPDSVNFTNVSQSNPRSAASHGEPAAADKINVSEPALGGFDDNEDDSLERNAALSSPIKAGKRLTSAAIVKIEDTTRSTTSQGPIAGKIIYTNKDLPSGALDNGRWRQVLIPTYLQFLGSRENPWSISDQTTVKAIQTIWDKVYASVELSHEVVINGPVHGVANQRAYEWRGGFGSTAITVLEAFFFEYSDDFGTDNERSSFAADQLDGLSFIYSDGEAKKGPFRSTFILQTFASHFSATRNAIVITEFSDANAMTLARGALAMSAAAVERSLTLCAEGEAAMVKKRGVSKTMNKASGKESTKANAFGEDNWGRATSGYMKTIKKLKDSQFAKVVEATKPFVKATRRFVERDNFDEDYDSDAENDERACIAIDSDSDDDA